MALPQHYIGLMSGTSLDGIDGVLVAFDDVALACHPLPLRVVAHQHQGFAPALADELLALNRPGANELHRAAQAAHALAGTSAAVVQALLSQAALAPAAVTAIGSHGQTLRHQPQPATGAAYTLQLDHPSLLAELTSIDVVADFRSRDMAAGGQGAPLVPAFHRAVFGVAGQARAVLNLGGIANLTVLAADGATTGFDCGPANVLLDAWCRQHTGQPFDEAGRWAGGGRVVPGLLNAFQQEAFFQRPPPKSTGRDLFHDGWLQRCLQAAGAAHEAAQDVQRTLVELTAWACAEAVRAQAPAAPELLVCGGGALNDFLLQRLQALQPGLTVRLSDAAGLPCQQVEAAAFAWLARRFIARQPGNLPAVTGARGPRVLGALYPAY